MIASLAVSPEQIRYWTEHALGCLEELDRDTAIEEVRHDLEAIERYLDALSFADDPVLVSGACGIKPGVRLELLVKDHDA